MMTQPALLGPRAVADIDQGLVLASVEIAAPPARVFSALASAEIAEWWGSPELYRVTKWTGDVRAGGWWRSEGVNADGKTFAVGGEILEYDPPRLIVQTWKFDGVSTPATTLRIRVDEIPHGSRVTVRHSGFASDADCEGHARGWERVFGWLTRWIGEG